MATAARLVLATLTVMTTTGGAMACGAAWPADAGSVSVDVPVPAQSAATVDRALGDAREAVARAAVGRCGGTPALVGPIEGGDWSDAPGGVQLAVSALYVCGR